MKLEAKRDIEKLMIDHKNYITQDLIIEVLQRFDITTHSDDFKKITHLIFDVDEMVSKILDWFENDLKITVCTRDILIYGHKHYYSRISPNEYHDNKSVEIRTIDKISNKECLFVDINQTIFATFKYVLEHINEYKIDKKNN